MLAFVKLTKKQVAMLEHAELLPQGNRPSRFKLKSQRKCTVTAEQNNRKGQDNNESVRCVNGINKEFIQTDSLFLITRNLPSGILLAELKNSSKPCFVLSRIFYHLVKMNQ